MAILSFVLRTPGAVGPPPQRPEIGQPADAPKCDHSETDLRRMRRADGVWVARPQCLVCGHGLQFVKKETVPGFEFLPVFDKDLQAAWREKVDRYYKDRREEYQRALADHDAKWWEWYSSYLRTDRWRRVRERVLARDRYQCAGCGERRATQAHHMTYVRVGREMLFDLVSVCDQCHEACHAG